MLEQFPEKIVYKLVQNVEAGLLFCQNDNQFTILFANDYFYRMVGYTEEEIQERFENRLSMLIVDNISQLLEKVASAIEQNMEINYELSIRRKDGSILYVQNMAVYDASYDAFYMAIMDITDKKSVQYELERIMSIFDQIPNKIVVADIYGHIQHQNAEADQCVHFAWPVNGPHTIQAMMKGHVIGEQFSDLWNRVLSGEVVQYETWFRSGNIIQGHDRNYLMPIRNRQDGTITGIMQVSEDLSKQNDALTAFPSRTMFENYYNSQMRHQKGHWKCALIILDIDDFKSINDRFGHSIGDLAIQETAGRITAMIQDDEYVCRYGGDEFLILLQTADQEYICQRLQQFHKLSQQPLEIGSISFRMTYSIGVAIVQQENMSYIDLFEHADQALYQVKHRGKNGFAIYQMQKAD